MKNGIRYQDGRFIVTAEQQEWAVKLALEALRGDNPDKFRLFAEEMILPPIKKVADYTEWLGGVLQVRQRQIGNQVVRVAVDTPTVIASYTSIDGSPQFYRPGRKYVSTTYHIFNTGIEIGWYDVQSAGWPILEQKINEVGQALARKRDEIRRAAIDHAVEATAGRTSSVSTTMTKASVDAIFESAASIGFPIRRVRINPATMMDMTSWTWPANSMWNRLGPERAEEVVRTGFVTGYGGALWEANVNVPASLVYFFSDPQFVGYEFTVSGFPENRSGTDIKQGVNYVRYDDALGAYAIGNAVWRLQIT